MDSSRGSRRPHSAKGSHAVDSRRFRRPLLRTLILAATLLAAWISVGTYLFVFPAADLPERSDAIVVLAPVHPTGRLEYAESLMSEGLSTTLVLSIPGYGSAGGSAAICPESSKGYRIICFSPDPETTEGEAKAIKRLSEEYGWHKVTVVTNDFHVTRARAIIERCFPYELKVAAVRYPLSFTNWTYQFLYESAAFVKASAPTEC